MGEGLGIVTRSFIVLAPTEFMMWIASWRMNTVKRRDTIFGTLVLSSAGEVVRWAC